MNPVALLRDAVYFEPENDILSHFSSSPSKEQPQMGPSRKQILSTRDETISVIAFPSSNCHVGSGNSLGKVTLLHRRDWYLVICGYVLVIVRDSSAHLPIVSGTTSHG